MSDQPRSPSLFDALLPLAILIGLLAAAVYYFGDDSSSGPNQIALMCCAGLAMVIGLKNGHPWQSIEQGMIRGVSLTLGAILILLAVGSLIGTWLLAGTVPTMIYYGLQIIHPSVFYATCCILCAVVALCIGSSWTVAATIGVALIGVAQSFNISVPVTAGAIISGAYFGDKMSPLSDTTNLAPAIAGSDLFTHIRHMAWSAVPSFILALLVFVGLGLNEEVVVSASGLEQLLGQLQQEFHIGWYLLVPLVVTLGLAIKKVPAFPAVAIGALVGALWAVLFQQDLIARLAGTELDSVDASIVVVWRTLFEGITINTGDAAMDSLLSGGGMGSMLSTIWLIISAMVFGSVMEQTGLLKRVVEALLSAAHSSGGLISATIATAFGTNCIAADQYIAIVMPGRMYKDEYARRELAPENLSRALEDGGTVTSPLVPWNTCGAYMHSVLMVNPLDYALYCFFNWLSPLIGISCAMLGLKVKALVKKTPGGEASLSAGELTG